LGTNIRRIKTGSLSRTDRVAKFNQLFEVAGKKLDGAERHLCPTRLCGRAALPRRREAWK